MTKLIPGFRVYLDECPPPTASDPASPPARVPLSGKNPKVFGPYRIPFGSREFALRFSTGKLQEGAMASAEHRTASSPGSERTSGQVTAGPSLPAQGVPQQGRSTQRRLLNALPVRTGEQGAPLLSSALSPAVTSTVADGESSRCLDMPGHVTPDVSQPVPASSSSEDRVSTSSHPESSSGEHSVKFSAARTRRPDRRKLKFPIERNNGKQIHRSPEGSNPAASKPFALKAKSTQSRHQAASSRGVRSHHATAADSTNSSGSSLVMQSLRSRRRESSGREKEKRLLSDLRVTNLNEYNDFLEVYDSEYPTPESIERAAAASTKIFDKIWAEITPEDIENKIASFHARCDGFIKIRDEDELNEMKNAIHRDYSRESATINTAIKIKITDEPQQLNCHAQWYYVETRLSLE